MTRRLIVAGAGGFATELVEYLLQDIAAGHLQGCEVAGVLDDFPDRFYSKSGLEVPLLGGIQDYAFRADEYALVALGTPRDRSTVVARLKQNGARFFTYVHSSCYLARNARLGEGVVACPNAIINANAEVADHVALNIASSVGHGAVVGAFSVLSPFAALNGNARIGERCFLSTRATVFPRVSLGNDCTVDVHSYAKASTEDGMIITHRGTYQVLENRML
ncbi:acetyltransferase [Niveibacterium sp. SC-1]|uniref:acetyltransferase n=1 Tax=Niveibacterium sp. SC-1 TaxID=3135646 RepID=UPI00312054FA